MAMKHGLGRGLGALIRDTPAAVEETPKDGVTRVEVGRIKPSPWQPRHHFSHEAHAEMVASVRERGVLQPLLVRRSGEGFELIAGERRWRAATEAGLKDVPVLIKDVSDHEALELALIENLQREDLDVIEEAEGYRALADKFNLTQDEIAQKVNKARASVANALRLLSLPSQIRQFLTEGLISAGHAKVLLGVPIEQEQCLLAERVVQEDMSVRELERLVERMKRAPRKRREVKADIPADHLSYITNMLHQHFGTSIRVQPCRTLPNGRKVKGSIEIDYFSNEDMDRILELLGLSEKQ